VNVFTIVFSFEEIKVIHKRRTEGGELCQKWTNVDMGRGLYKLQLMSSNCTIPL